MTGRKRKKHFLCRIGIHKKVDVLHKKNGYWFYKGTVSHQKCKRCGKQFRESYDYGFDGTDNA